MSLRDLLESGANVSVTVTLDDLRAIFNEAAKGPGGFQLVIDLIPILQWFRQKAEEFLERLGIEIKDREQGRGMWMR